MEEEYTEQKQHRQHLRQKIPWFWIWIAASVVLRLVLIYFSENLNLSSRPEVATPLTSIRRLAEGYWLKQSSMSPYSGSMYHGSPLLLLVLGPLTVKRIRGQLDHLFCSFAFVIADIICAILIRAIGQILQRSRHRSLNFLKLNHLEENPEVLPSGDIAALIYLWNPFTIVACVGLSTSPVENLSVILSLYGACMGLPSLAAFGWVMAVHLSLYPAILIIPLVFLLGYGSDTPPRKLLLAKFNIHQETDGKDQLLSCSFSWRSITHFFFWVLLWSSYLLVLCGIYVRQHGGLWEMFKRTYGFILTVQDLSPNIGVLWYFFAEVFDFFRYFFLIVFHGNILFMLMPLALRLNHRPCFLAFTYMVIASMLKSYPSVGDYALYFGLLGLFANELSDMQFSFFLFCGYIGVSLISPVMHNLWIWRGTGNANFYFATGIAYTCLQIILAVESVSAMLNHDRMLRKLSSEKLDDGTS